LSVREEKKNQGKKKKKRGGRSNGGYQLPFFLPFLPHSIGREEKGGKTEEGGSGGLCSIFGPSSSFITPSMRIGQPGERTGREEEKKKKKKGGENRSSAVQWFAQIGYWPPATR